MVTYLHVFFWQNVKQCSGLRCYYITLHISATARNFSFTISDSKSLGPYVRKGERDAERANTISAYRASLGLGPPLTLAEKQERAAAKAASRINALEAMVSPAQRMADAQANQDAQWYEYHT